MMKVERSYSWILATVIFFAMAEAFAASRSVTVLGQVRMPGTVELNEGDDLLMVVKRAGGLARFADFHRVTVRQKQPESAVRALVVDLERLEQEP